MKNESFLQWHKRIIREGIKSFFEPLPYLWTFPNTLLGLILLCGGKIRLHTGCVEGHSALTRWVLRNNPLCKNADALTLGHVIIGRDWNTLDLTRKHERAHVRQYQRWGPFFLPAYLLSSFYLKLRGKDAYRDNPFEIEAYSIDFL